jgi:Domain of unknown function (DUF2014)/Helix-loop-helix DNA-binding domain
MQWDGEEARSPPYQSTSTTLGDDDGGPSESGNIIRKYPVSPSSTANSDANYLLSLPSTLDGINHSTTPLTPIHSSSSPETLHLPASRLSGETLRSTSSSDLPRLTLKRKSSDDHEPTSVVYGRGQQKPASKKRPHNVIEKRYRANLNEKIAELRESVPSLRSAPKAGKEKHDVDDDAEDQAGSNKLNKASILTKAVEYIRHLELRNKRLDDENVMLKQRLIKLEKVISAGGNNAAERAAAFTSKVTMEQKPQETGTDADNERKVKHPPQGLIPVPESMRKLREGRSQEHYGAVYDSPQEGQRGGRRWPAKFMLGSLAGLMIVDGLTEGQVGSESKAKGLFGIPLEFMDGWWFLRSPKAFIAAFMQYCRTGGVLPLVKGFLALTLLAFIVFAYLFNSKPAETDDEEKPSQLRRVPSLASPIEVRRQAWLTSMQTLKLPHHSFFPEWFAVNVEWLKYTIRLVLGFPTYSRITGRSGEDELARVKAWDIAIDAQLAGGDPEISRSRLVLSIFASGTLPQTPFRLMLKALHCRVVLWKVGCDGGVLCRNSNKIAAALANRQWKKARKLNSEVKVGDADALPAHLTALLKEDCSEVMLDSVVQRAYNLMYDRPTDEWSCGTNALMDIVVEDHAIRSPLDALAAWWSSEKLQQALVHSMADNEQTCHQFQPSIKQALAIAPPLSAAYVRALAVRSVFVEDQRDRHVELVQNALPSSTSHHALEKPLQGSAPIFIDSSVPASACTELSTILECAKVLMELRPRSEARGTVREAADRLASLKLEPAGMSLLSFAPVFHVLSQLLSESAAFPPSRFSETINYLTEWAHAEADSSLLSPGVVAKLDLLCHETGEKHITRRQSSVSNDTGYASLGDADIA